MAATVAQASLVEFKQQAALCQESPTVEGTMALFLAAEKTNFKLQLPEIAEIALSCMGLLSDDDAGICISQLNAQKEPVWMAINARAERNRELLAQRNEMLAIPDLDDSSEGMGHEDVMASTIMGLARRGVFTV